MYRKLWIKLREFVELIDCLDDLNYKQLKGLIKFFKLRELKINFRYRLKKLLISIAKFYGIFPGSIISTRTIDMNTSKSVIIRGEVLHYTQGYSFNVFWFYKDVTENEIENGSFRCCSIIDDSEIKVISNPEKFRSYQGKDRPNNYYYDRGRLIDDNIKYLLRIVDMLPNPPKVLFYKPLEIDF